MIVEFLEGRDFMTAWVMEPSPRRLAVLGQNGRDMTISQNRVLNSAELPDPGNKSGRLELLRATDSVRRSLAEAVELDEMWEILEGEGDQFAFGALASLYFGRSVSADDVSAITRAVFNDGLKFRFTPEGAVRNSTDEVTKILEERRRAEESERALKALAEWVALAVRGEVAPEPPEADSARQALLDLALSGEKAPRRGEANRILERAGLPADEKGAVEALTGLGEFTRHENLELRRLDIPLSFEPEVMEEVAGLSSSVAAKKAGRLDLTGLYTMTIDSNGARDLDDAISIKSLAGGRWQVGVHITDVAAFITPDSPLDLEARSRGCSIYLPEGKYPMLPAELSEGLLSLTPGDVKPAFSFLATVEKDGSVSEYSTASSLIRVDRQLSFSEADQTMDDDSDLVDLWDMAQALIAWREAKGGVNLNIPKLNVYFQPDGALSVGLTQWDTPAKTIVSELMILANYLAADLLHKNGYPCPYRFQEKPRQPDPSEAALKAGNKDPDLELALNLAARRRTGRSGLSFVPATHYGLGLPVYTAFTAPMRRYVDLLVARQLRSLSDGGPPAMNEQEFLRLALPAHDLQQRIQKMQNNRQRYWLMTYLAGSVGREYSALVFEQRDRRLRVCVTDYMLETEMFLPRESGGPTPQMFGKRLKLKLAAVEPGEIMPRFVIVS
ncbi:hypothetical protein C4J81_16880 [Deltaproteobacteria bacterium Smac51]|nr:hypothetical protein C4J81_16880 [Deltaproteobacteria bacterium Smac51]